MSYTEQVPLLAPSHLKSSQPASRRLVSQIIARWQQGEPADTRAFLDEHPELATNKSLVLDLAYEEYCLRAEAGAAIDLDEFCARFPTFKASLRKLLEAHQFLQQNPDLLVEQPAIHWPEVGDFFLGFALLDELGRGAFARVYLAAESALGNRRVAVKVAFQGASEADILGRFRHPNIVPVHSVQEDEGTGLTVVCMPYLGRATLCDVLDKAFAGPGLPTQARVFLNVAQDNQLAEEPQRPDPLLRKASFIDGVVHIGVQLAEALAYTHARGILHRDLKPSNVLLTPEGRPMLMDFNLAFDAQLTDNLLGGTLPYMAPEQLRAMDPDSQGQPPVGDARSDLFGLGVILYELLTGSLPFGPLPPQGTFREISGHLLERQRQGPRPLQQANPQVDKHLAGIIEQCLAFDLSDRPESAAELAAALRKTLSPTWRLRRWLGQHGRAVLAAVAITLATCFAGGYYTADYLAHRPPYSVRQLNQGWELYRQGDYRQAVQYFDQAIEADPTLAEAFYARGRAYQQLEEFELALSSYCRADQLVQDGRVMACIGYCLQRSGQYKPTVPHYRRAIDAGYARAEVYNNLSYSYLYSSTAPEDLSKVEKWLTQAIELNPRLQAAFHNRVVLHLRLVCHSKQLADSWHSDIQKALELGPVTADLCFDIARLYAKAAQIEKDPQWSELALDYLEKAWACGQTFPNLEKDTNFAALHDNHRFKEIIRRPPQLSSSGKAQLIVDPVRDF